MKAVFSRMDKQCYGLSKLEASKEVVRMHSVVAHAHYQIFDVVRVTCFASKRRSLYCVVHAHLDAYPSPLFEDYGEPTRKLLRLVHNVAGMGKARGAGYRKVSTAINAAIMDAGIALYDNNGCLEGIAGKGDGAIEEALLAIGRECLKDIPAIELKYFLRSFCR